MLASVEGEKAENREKNPWNKTKTNNKRNPHMPPGSRFSKAQESVRARKAIFRSSVSKNGEVYTPETYCMKGTSLHL